MEPSLNGMIAALNGIAWDLLLRPKRANWAPRKPAGLPLLPLARVEVTRCFRARNSDVGFGGLGLGEPPVGGSATLGGEERGKDQHSTAR